jgi:hypothetical protein
MLIYWRVNGGNDKLDIFNGYELNQVNLGFMGNITVATVVGLTS